MLKIHQLRASVDGSEILTGIDLNVNAGEVHAIMGPNGSGKSTLAQVLAGKEDYEVTHGSVSYNGKDLLELSPEDRAKEGFFMAFRYRRKADPFGQRRGEMFGRRFISPADASLRAGEPLHPPP